MNENTARLTFQDEIVAAILDGSPSRGMLRDFAMLLRDGHVAPTHPAIPAVRAKLEVIRTTHPVLRHRWRARLAIEAIEEAERTLDPSRPLA